MGAFSLDFMRSHQRRFIEMISARHPLRRETLDRYAGVLSWPHLSTNERLPWGRSLVEAHAPRWAWLDLYACLSRLASLAGSVEVLQPLAELGPSYYGFARHIERSLAGRAQLETWVSAGASPPLGEVLEWPTDAVHWLPELVDRAAADVRPRLWQELSGCERFPWTVAFIDEHAGALSWWHASRNSALPWSLELIRRYEDRWDWNGLLEVCWASEHDEHLERVEAILDLAGDRIDWSRLIGEVVWTVERFELVRERLEACGAGEDGSDYWTFAITPRRWTAAFVDRLVVRQAELGRPTVDWQALARHGGERLWTRAFYERHRDRLDHERLVENPAVAVLLDPDDVEAFLCACAQPLEALGRDFGLEAVNAAAPACASALGIDHGALEWRNGFIRCAAWFRKHDPGDWRLALRLRPFAFVEELLIVDGVHRGFGQFDRARIRDEDWELLASMPCLTKLALHQVCIETTSKLRELVRITALDLDGTCVFDLSVLAGMPSLRSLVLHEDLWALYWSGVECSSTPIAQLRALIDLAPLAEISELRHLGLRSSDVGSDLRPLRGCRNLETLELGVGYLYDLSVLDQLPGLRRLWIGVLDESELEPLRARHPGLAINAGPRPWSTWRPDVAAWARPPAGYPGDDD